MPPKKHGFGWKKTVLPLTNLDNIWFQMRDTLINRYVGMPTVDGQPKIFKIIEVELRLPVLDSIVVLDRADLDDYIGVKYTDLREQILSGQAIFNPSLIPLLP